MEMHVHRNVLVPHRQWTCSRGDRRPRPRGRPVLAGTRRCGRLSLGAAFPERCRERRRETEHRSRERRDGRAGASNPARARVLSGASTVKRV